jgi:hypothetical protein
VHPLAAHRAFLSLGHADWTLALERRLDKHQGGPYRWLDFIVAREYFRDDSLGPAAPADRLSHPADAPDGCFADEVAIDFPSVRHAVERMRDVFFGQGGRDGGDLVRVELCLSRQEARVGAVVPLEVPLRVTCERCGGRGETWAEPCSRCGGTGESMIAHGVHLWIPAGVSDGARFRFRMASPAVASVRVEVRVVINRSA